MKYLTQLFIVLHEYNHCFLPQLASPFILIACYENISRKQRLVLEFIQILYVDIKKYEWCSVLFYAHLKH